jgi:2-methylcitrate dehydratase PrpD
MPASLTRAEVLARFVTETADGAIPDCIRAKARRHILDTLACGLAGACSSEGIRLVAMLAATEPSGFSPAWGTPQLLSPRSAALANGTAAHAFELDDTGGCDHSGAVVVPAALAALDLAPGPVSGRAFITAIVLGYDVARRVLEACGAYAPHNEAGWHSTATCGTFGAAAAASRILNLSADQSADALGHAASFSGGLWAFIHDGAQTKRIHAGRAAEGGLLAALLAGGGLTGPHQVFEDVWGGFLKTLAPLSALPDALNQDLGRTWRLERVALKPHAACRGAHAAIDAVGEILARESLQASDIRAITVSGPTLLSSMCGGRDLSGLPGAQMSLPYALAVRITRGAADIDSYPAAVRDDAATRAMMDRVVLTEHPTLVGSEEPYVTLETQDNRIVEHRVVAALGSPANPLSDDAAWGKVRRLAAMVLSPPAIDALVAAIATLEEADDIRSLPALLACRTPPTPFL